MKEKITFLLLTLYMLSSFKLTSQVISMSFDDDSDITSNSLGLEVTTNATFSSDAKFGDGALLMDSSHCIFDTTDAIDFTQDVSVSMWVKTPDISTSTTLMAITQYTGNLDSTGSDTWIPGGFFVAVGSESNIGFDVGWEGGAWDNDSTGIDDNEWHHLVVIWDYQDDDRTNVVILMDKDTVVSDIKNIKDPTWGDTNPVLADHVLKLGYTHNRGDAPINFSGLIDEVQVFNSILTPEEIASLFSVNKLPKPEQQAFALNFDNMSKLTSNFSDIEVTTNGTYSSDAKFGYGALLMDSSYCIVDTTDEIDFTNDVSISMWVKTPDINETTALLAITQYTGNLDSTGSDTWIPGGFFVAVGSESNVGFDVGWEGGAWDNDSTGIDDNEWHHLVVIWDYQDDDRTNVVILMDKDTVVSDIKNIKDPTWGDTNPVLTDHVLKLGYVHNRGDGPKNFSGSFDEVQVYNTALTIKEITSLYETNKLPQSVIAKFSASPLDIMEGETVQFTDESKNDPSSWSWTFEGGTPAASTDQNPTVQYNVEGTYSVTLIVENENGKDSLTKSQLISVVAPPPTLELVNTFNFDDKNDLTANTLSLSVTNTAEYTSISRSGSGALALDSSHFIIEKSDKIDFEQDLSISMWVKTSDTISTSTVLFAITQFTGNLDSTGSDTWIPGGFFVAIGSNRNLGFDVGWEGGAWDDTITGIDDKTWHHLVVTWDYQVDQTTKVDVLLDKDTIVTRTLNIKDPTWSDTNPVLADHVLKLGYAHNRGETSDPGPMIGSIDQLNIFSGLLTLNKIDSLFNVEYTSVPPEAAFSADVVEVNEGGSVQFTDESLNDPTSWSWTFEGGTPATSTDQNPSITFADPGKYNVTLIVSNAEGSDTLKVFDYITVKRVDAISENNAELSIRIIPNPMNNLVSIVGINPEIVEFFNISGSKVASYHITGTGQQINVDDLTPGIYFIKITADNISYIRKVIKK